jgi:hypothetical protein
LSDLSFCVELDPGIDRDGDENSEGGCVESYHRGCRGDVVVGGELSYIICDRDTDKTDVLWIRKEAEDVFAVEFISIEGAGNVNTSLDLRFVSNVQ